MYAQIVAQTAIQADIVIVLICHHKGR